MAAHRTRLLAITAAVLLALALAACSSSKKKSSPTTTSTTAQPSTSPSSSTTAVPPTSAGSSTTNPSAYPRCDVDTLQVALGPPPGGQPGLGHLAAEITLTNTSTAPCTVLGYAGLGLLDAAGNPLMASTDRGGYLRGVDPGPNLIALPPRGQASAEISWTDVPDACANGGRTLLVTPPDSTRQLRTGWNGSPVCDGGRFSVTAFKRA